MRFCINILKLLWTRPVIRDLKSTLDNKDFDQRTELHEDAGHD